MALLALVSGVLALAAVVGGIVLVVVRTRELLRGFRAFARSLGVAASRLEASARKLSEENPDGGESSARLSAGLDRLSESRARLGVLLAALAEVRASVTRLTAVTSRK